MSGKVKDLRELVCVSRLTVRHSDDEYISSDEGDVVERFGSALGRFRSLALEDSSSENFTRDFLSGDSGISTANQSPQEGQDAHGIPSNDTVSQAGAKLKKTADSTPVPRFSRRKKRKPKGNANNSAVVQTGHEFPRLTPLPPVASSSSISRQSSGSSSAGSVRSPPASAPYPARTPTPITGTRGRKEGDFDELLSYLDSTLVSEWLQSCNKAVSDMATWCHAGENFVNFAHFLLTDFPTQQKMEIFKMEYEILVKSVKFAFAVGLDSESITWKEVSTFLSAVFREYPQKLLSSGGSYLFLDYLHVLTSERQDEYKTVLSNVKCSTRNRQYAQLVLAVRSFALVNMWYAVTNFYRSIAPDRKEVLAEAIPIAEVNKKDPHVHRMYHAIR